jgi:hypothetical protein
MNDPNPLNGADNSENLQERDWRRLIDSICRGNCVLMLGPDVAVDPYTLSGSPLTSLFARELAEQLPPDIPEVIRDDLAAVTQLYLDDQVGYRVDLQLEVDDFYRPFIGRTTQLHLDLAALPFSLCLVTTPDRFLRQAFEEVAGKSPVSAFYNFADPGRSMTVPEGAITHPVIYSLFGDLDAPESLVLTESDLLDVLVKTVRGSSGIPATVTAQLRDTQTSFLFVGFGFQRWYARVLLHVLKAQSRRSPSMALESADFYGHCDVARATVYFRHSHAINFRRCDWFQVAAELHRRYAATVPQQDDQGSRELPAGAPKVFLCHDSRDHGEVELLEQRLHQLGVDTWRDRQGLRGGDQWDRRIQQVIRKQVAYVLVLETPNMASAPRKYFHKEIAEAEEQQKEFDVEERFLIPATLIDGPGLRRLDEFNRVNLTTEAGITRLASDLLADFGRRKRREQGLAS